jgi:hypothetical protein
VVVANQRLWTGVRVCGDSAGDEVSPSERVTLDTAPVKKRAQGAGEHRDDGDGACRSKSKMSTLAIASRASVAEAALVLGLAP